MRKLSFGFIAICLGTLLPLLVAEIACRFLPVATGALASPVNEANPIFRLTPDQDYLWSVGWRFSVVNRGRINNDGFVNDQDYDASDPRPLLAVIGDSYVEALMVPYPDTLQGRLQRCMGTRGRAYSFAASGAPLSQYLVWADYARDRYSPQLMAFVIIGNDFDESLAKYKTGPGFHHFTEAADGTTTLQRYDYSPASLRKIARSSALLRYLIFNLHLNTTLSNLWQKLLRTAQADGTPQHVGNTDSRSGAQRLHDSERAVAKFFEELPQRTQLAPSRIVFLMDGVRPQLYAGQEALAAVRNAYYPRMREFFMGEALARGYRVIDLQPRFMARHQADGALFEFPDDAHWNATGHEVAAQALLDDSAIQELFPVNSPPC